MCFCKWDELLFFASRVLDNGAPQFFDIFCSMNVVGSSHESVKDTYVCLGYIDAIDTTVLAAAEPTAPLLMPGSTHILGVRIKCFGQAKVSKVVKVIDKARKADDTGLPLTALPIGSTPIKWRHVAGTHSSHTSDVHCQRQLRALPLTLYPIPPPKPVRAVASPSSRWPFVCFEDLVQLSALISPELVGSLMTRVAGWDILSPLFRAELIPPGQLFHFMRELGCTGNTSSSHNTSRRLS